MTGQEGQHLDAESPTMQAFLETRRVEVLDRAIATLESCPDIDLASEAHRLAGTLGIFGFDAASTRMRAFMRIIEDAADRPDLVSDARADALDYLRGIRADAGEKDPG